MALIVEDGSGVIDAEALVSVAFVDDYAIRYGKAGWSALSVDQKEINIRVATQFAVSKFPWNTRPLYAYQSYPFPAYQFDYRGSWVEGIPIQVRQAVAELAILNQSQSLTEGRVARDYIYKRTNIGGVEKELRWASPGHDSGSLFDTVELILAPLLGSIDGGLTQGRMLLA